MLSIFMFAKRSIRTRLDCRTAPYAAALIWIVGSAGCSEKTQVEHGTYVDLQYSRDEQVCGGTLEFLDSFVAKTVRYLGIEPPPGPILYGYRPEGVDDECMNKDVSGCSYSEDSIVFAEKPDLVHELVHAVVDWARRPHHFLREGLAVRLSNAAYASGVWSDLDLEAAWNVREDEVDTSRMDAAYVIGYLLDEFGPKAVMDLYRQLGPEATFDDFARVLNEVTGEDVDSLEQQIRQYDPSPWGLFPYTDDEDSPEAVALPWVSERTVSCSTDGIGPSDYDDGNDKVFAVDRLALETNSYRIEFEGEHGTAVLAHRDLKITLFYSADGAISGTARGRKAWVFAHLPKGAYTLIRTAPLEVEEPSRAAVALLTESLDTDCRVDAAYAVSIPPDVENISIPLVDSDTAALAFVLDEPRIVRLPPFSFDAVDLCDAQCQCAGIDTAEQQVLLTAGTVWWIRPALGSTEAGLMLISETDDTE